MTQHSTNALNCILIFPVTVAFTMQFAVGAAENRRQGSKHCTTTQLQRHEKSRVLHVQRSFSCFVWFTNSLSVWLNRWWWIVHVT